jgi:uncharacterized membrane protein YfcA
MKTLVIGLLLGSAAGLVGALCGVGGGILLVPAFALVLKMDQKHAVATSLAIVVVTATMGTLNHVVSNSKLIDWRIVAFTAVGAGAAAWFGTDLMRTMSSATLTKAFGILMVLVGVRMLMVKG